MKLQVMKDGKIVEDNYIIVVEDGMNVKAEVKGQFHFLATAAKSDELTDKIFDILETNVKHENYCNCPACETVVEKIKRVLKRKEEKKSGKCDCLSCRLSGILDDVMKNVFEQQEQENKEETDNNENKEENKENVE